jgi:hypothetical protein
LPHTTQLVLPVRIAAADASQMGVGDATAALRSEAAEILRRSPWYRRDCLRESLQERHWYGAPAAGPLDDDPRW